MARNSKYKLVIIGAFFSIFILVVVLYILNSDIAVLNPQGEIAEKQRNLLLFAAGMSLFIVLPVFFMTFFIAYKYREGNKNAVYRPEWDSSKILETLWWGIPTIMIIGLSVITFNSSHDLDPFKSIASDKKPITVQVVAMQWKWLFIYPEQQIASVNYLQFPEDTPVSFELTSDAPMNSFWIPQLGGQVYAMSGMTTQLHLIADNPGEYRGSSANISGRGFAGMNFTAKATSQGEFDNWVESTKNTPNALDEQSYVKLTQPSENNPVSFYSSVNNYLFENIVLKYSRYTYTGDVFSSQGDE